ncbi:MAG: hypothetical protein M0002_17700 [Rhodospirillales bacterium]|nr:hypothetical protein [Rhodospirillales bacterium]
MTSTLLASAVTSHASPAATVYPSAIAPLYQTAAGPAQIASLTPGTPLSVATPPANGAAREEITIEGWSEQGGGAVVYQAPDLRIILATLGQAGLSHRTVLGQQRDSYGTVWRHVELSGWVAVSSVVPSVATVWATAGKLFATRCSVCHALRNPAEFTANQWPSILRAMVKNAGLDAAQVALVTKYLQAHARAQ